MFKSVTWWVDSAESHTSRVNGTDENRALQNRGVDEAQQYRINDLSVIPNEQYSGTGLFF